MRNGKSGLFVKKRVHYLAWLRAQDEELINKSISENHKHLAKSLKNKISSACTKKKKKKLNQLKWIKMNLYKSQQQLPKCSLINTIFTQFRNLWEMGKLKKLMLTQSTQPFTLII